MKCSEKLKITSFKAIGLSIDKLAMWHNGFYNIKTTKVIVLIHAWQLIKISIKNFYDSKACPIQFQKHLFLKIKNFYSLYFPYALMIYIN